MPRKIASTAPQALDWIARWQADSRSIWVAYAVVTPPVVWLQFKGRVTELLPTEHGGAVRFSGAEGSAALQLTGAEVDPLLSAVAKEGRSTIVEFRKTFAGSVESIELVLPSGAVLFLWRES